MVSAISGGDVVAYNGSSHEIIRSGIVVYDKDCILHVGSSYDGKVERTINASGCIVCPGFINMHSHSILGQSDRLVSDMGRPDAFGTSYMSHYVTKPGTKPSYLKESKELAALSYIVESIKFGSTTLVDNGGGTPELARASKKLGVRVYSSPRFASANYVDKNGRIEYSFDESRAQAELDTAGSFIREYANDPEGLFQGMLFPHAVDTCSESLLENTLQLAKDLNVKIQIHAAQGLFEFIEMIRRTKLTPVRWLKQIGFLNENVILGHSFMLDHHPLAPATERLDLDLIVKSGAHVAHCPFVLARRGYAMHSFQRYLDSGCNITLGTDTSPRDIINEMRWGSYICKLIEGDYTFGKPADLFNAATLNGAFALGRNDLGRLSPGAKADIAVIRLNKVGVVPVLDPVKSLIHYAAGTPAEYVIINGRIVVDQGMVVGVDENALIQEIQAEADRLWADIPSWEAQGRNIEEMCPPSFPMK